MPVIFKPINPKHLKAEAFTRAIEQEARPYAEGVKRDFEKTFQNWKAEHKPTLTVKVNINPNGGVSIEIDVEGQIYEYVHEGTRPHDIMPRRAKRLKFQSGYQAKTLPGRIASVAGGPSGDTVFARGVEHPGFPGRKFSQQIVKKWRQPFYKAMQRALDKGAKDSGHAI
jgi:hypothetical protein